MSTITDILPRTFVHAPGVGRKTETALWEEGVTSWENFLSSSSTLPASLRSRSSIFRMIDKSVTALERVDTRFFAAHMPREEWWRLYTKFESKCVFLDIETTGLSHYYDEITVVGLYDGKKVKTLLAGHNLKGLSELLNPYDIVVTFNGTQFDIPFLKTKFPSLRLPPIHLDLRYLLRRLGLSGGLKQIERGLGIKRGKEAWDIDGLMATVLWARYLRGDTQALERLVKYNAADITSLQSLMRYSCQRLAARLLNGSHSGSRARLETPRTVSVQVKRINGSDVQLIVDRERVSLGIRKVERPLVTVRNLLARMPPAIGIPKVVGIDLRASETRPTGWALLAGEAAVTKIVKTDEEIIRETIRHDPDVISIDSPLGIPAGRCCTKDSCKCRVKGILRECERTLWRRGVRVFPCLLPSMQKLTERGMRLAKEFRKRGFTVIESYPGAAQDIMRIPRKKSSLADLAGGLQAFGIKGVGIENVCSHDELDAITSAVVGYFYLTGDHEALGNKQEEWLIIPKLNRLLNKSASA